MKRKIDFFKLLAILIMTFLLILSFAGGCAKPTTPAVPPPAEEKKDDAPPPETKVELPKVKGRIGGIHPVEGPYTAALKKFAESVAKKTNNGLTFDVYPASQLGGARELIESTQSGALEGTYVASAFYVPFMPTIAIPQLPYLFPSRDITYEVLIEGDLGKQILASLEAVNLKGVGFFEGGFQQLTANFPVRHPDDLQGKKIRVMENPVLIAQYQALGATPTPISFAELYTALQQGVVDGQENPLGGIYDMKLYEVQKYITLSDHAFLGIALAFNKQWYDNLPAEYQKAMAEAAYEEALALRKVIEEMEVKNMLPAIMNAGLEVIELTPEQSKAFAEKAGPAAENALRGMMDPAGNELLDKVKKEIDKLR
ncbi:MAG: TRAP transporter substrate-binding protein [Bacillota bacterium]